MTETFLWVILPYITLTIFFVGLAWRWRYDQYGWTSRSSQIHEHVILRAASPLFHLGIILVFFGHLLGLIIPKAWTEGVGVEQHTYHLVATIGGSIAAVLTIVGLLGLLYRRFTTRAVALATTGMDKLMYLLLLIPIGLGTYATVVNQVMGGSEGYDYRETISPWLRSLFIFQPQPELMADVPLSFKLHIIAAFLLFALWPFTRLVHVFSAPVGYTTRPYIVYRSREASVSTTPTQAGWDPVDKAGPRSDSGARPRGA